MDKKSNITGTPSGAIKTGGAYGAGSLTAGGPSVSAATSSVPAAGGNNPRIDLLHNAGSNMKLNETPPPSAPKVTAVPTPAPVPISAPAPAPIPTPLPAAPPVRKSKKGLTATVIVVLLLSLLGGGIWWWMNKPSETATETPPPSVALTAVEPTKLSVSNDKKTAVAAGGATGGANNSFSGTLETKANSGSAVAEIEIQPIGTAFTGEPTFTGEPVNANGSDLTLTVVVATLTEGNYHWQIRSVVEGEKSKWVAAGDGIKPDFTVDTTPPLVPVLKTFDGKAASSSLTAENTKPVFTGTSEPNADILITIDQQKITATANEKGEWQATPTTDIAKGTYSPTIVATDTAGNVGGALTLALVISGPVAAQQTPPPPAATPPPAPEPAPAPAAAPTELAKTGESTSTTTAAAMVLLGMSLACIVLMRRYGWR